MSDLRDMGFASEDPDLKVGPADPAEDLQLLPLAAVYARAVQRVRREVGVLAHSGLAAQPTAEAERATLVG
jgi:hypothetical protein